MEDKTLNVKLVDFGNATRILDTQISGIKRKILLREADFNTLRKAYSRTLDKMVSFFLPDLAPHRLVALEKAFPDFAEKYATYFAYPTKFQRFIGMFYKPEDDQKLPLIQTQLRALIDEAVYGDELKSLNKKMSSLREEVRKLRDLDDKLSARLTQLRTTYLGLKGGKIKPSKVNTAPLREIQHVQTTSNSDDSNLFQTLLILDMFSSHNHHHRDEPFVGKGGEFSGAGASGGWDTGAVSTPSISSNREMELTPVMAIATDDSLGRFS